MAVAPNLYWKIDGEPPTTWQTAVAKLTSEEKADHWGLEAAIFIARIRKRTGQGPSFAQLFEYLARTDASLLPTALPDTLPSATRRLQVYRFRRAVCIEWRRRHWISWGPQPLSLRVGRRFREASRLYIARDRDRSEPSG